MSIIKVNQIENNTPNTQIIVSGGAGTSGMGSASAPFLTTDFTNKSFIDAEIATVNAAKEPNITAGTTAQYYRGDKTFQTLNKTNIAGLTDSDDPSFNQIISTVAPGNPPFVVASTTQVANLYVEKADETVKVTWGHNSVTASAVETTTSDVDILIPGLAATPAAGTYEARLNSAFTLTPKFITAQGAADLNITYAILSGETQTHTHAVGFVTETLFAGVYDIAGAGTLDGTLTLDAQSDPDAVFIFRFSTTFSTAASAVIALAGGAQAKNVFFVTTTGAISILASNTVSGNFVANGTITLGAGVVVTGRLLSTAGAIAMTTSTVSVPSGTSPFDLGVLDSFAVFTNSGAITSTGASTIVGDAGTNLGAFTTFTTSTITGGEYTSTSKSGEVFFSFYINNVLVADSQRARTNFNNSADINLLAVIVSPGAQVIDVRWRLGLGISTSVSNRIFTLTRVV
jgi:hypothetical protein